MRKKWVSPYAFVFPLILLLSFVYVIPFINLFRYSLTDRTLAQPGQFIGFQNFLSLTEFGPTVLRTLFWTFGSVIPATALGLGIALLFRGSFFGKKLLTITMLVPYAMPLAVCGFLWLIVYNMDFGLINVLALRTGLVEKPVRFLSYHRALFSVTFVRIWRAFPIAFISYYAGLKSIPEVLYEAAKVDGANAWQQFLHITLPQLRSVTLVVLIILTVWTTLVFDIIWIMTAGGPIEATTIIPIDIYKTAFQSMEIGKASAMSLATVVILLVISFIYWKLIHAER